MDKSPTLDNAKLDKMIEKLMVMELPDAKEVESLCQKAKNDLIEDANVIQIQAPVTIVGDISGNFTDLMEVFKQQGHLPQTRYVFLGDYSFEEGNESLEVIILLLALKVRYGGQITLLRGSAESRQISKHYGLHNEIQEQYPDTHVYTSLCEFFDYLPLAACIDKKIFCVHSGLAQDCKTIAQMNDIDRLQEIPDKGAMREVLWAVPGNASGWNLAGDSQNYEYGPDVTEKFLEANELDIIICSGRVEKTGYAFLHDDMIVRIFSCSNYGGKMINPGCLVDIDSELKIKFHHWDAKKE